MEEVQEYCTTGTGKHTVRLCQDPGEDLMSVMDAKRYRKDLTVNTYRYMRTATVEAGILTPLHAGKPPSIQISIQNYVYVGQETIGKTEGEPPSKLKKLVGGAEREDERDDQHPKKLMRERGMRIH